MSRDDPPRDLVELIDYRFALIDSISASLAARRATRSIGQQTYKARSERAHRERMAAATAFQGEQR